MWRVPGEAYRGRVAPIRAALSSAAVTIGATHVSGENT